MQIFFPFFVGFLVCWLQFAIVNKIKTEDEEEKNKMRISA